MIEKMKENRWLFFFEGFLFILLGFVAIILPQLATFSLGITFGLILLISSLMLAYKAFKFRKEKDIFWSSLLSGVVSFLAGMLMFKYFGAGIYILTTLLVIYLSFEGLSKIILSVMLKPLTNSFMLMLSGIITLLLAMIIMAGLPGTATIVLGLLFGVHLLVSGFSMISLAFGFGKLTGTHAH